MVKEIDRLYVVSLYKIVGAGKAIILVPIEGLADERRVYSNSHDAMERKLELMDRISAYGLQKECCVVIDKNTFPRRKVIERRFHYGNDREGAEGC